jgi:RNA polymerase sigma-70 factor (ECF subfamily)
MAADKADLGSLFQEHGKAMLAYAQRLTGDRGAAEDAVQEALLRAWRHQDRLTESQGSVRGWLMTVVRNIITDTVRARHVRPLEVGAPTTNVASEPDHADDVLESIVVRDVLDRLSAEHREVLEQLYLLDGTVTGAAEALDIPAGTVKSRSFYALRALRAMHPQGRLAESRPV